MKIKTKKLLMVTLLLLCIFPLIPSAFAEVNSVTDATVTIENNQDITFKAIIGVENKTLEYNNVTTTFPNVTALLFNISKDDFINETFFDINLTLSQDFNLTIANFTLDFNITAQSFTLAFNLNDTVQNLNVTTENNETIVYNDTYTFDVDWLDFTVYYKITNNITIDNESIEVTWNSSDVFVFNELSEYPVEMWNRTWNLLFYNLTLSNTSYIYVELKLPDMARNITIDGNKITYHIPKPVDYPAIERFTIFGALFIVAGLGLFIFTSRQSRIEKYKKKLLKKERKEVKESIKEKVVKPKKEKTKKKKWKRYKQR